MRRSLPPFLVLLAGFLGWTRSLAVDPPAPRAARGLDGPAASRWSVHAPHSAAPAPAAAAVPEGWLASAGRAIAAREYEATPNGEGLQAPNRAHGFRTYFEPAGVRLVDRAAGAPASLVALRLSRAGREEHLVAAVPGVVSAQGARVEIRRVGGLVEWYENSPRGLEQGFTFAERPHGAGALVVDLAVSGAAVGAAGDGASFATPHGRRLGYAALAAADARGRALPARLETGDGAVRLVVDDAGAAYPVTIDPLVTGSSEAQLLRAQAGAHFGRTVAGVGDVNGDGFEDVLVGAEAYDSGQTDEGAAFLYLGGPGGIPNGALPSATFQSDLASTFMGFVAAAGDVNGDGYADVMMGGYGWNAGRGAVFIFHGGPGGIASGSPATAATILSSTVVGASFGLIPGSFTDVNGDGYSDVIIGAPDYNGSGAVFVFLGSATGVASASTATAATVLTCGQATASFGGGVAGADFNGDGFGDVAAGAYRYDNGSTNEGAAFIWYGGVTGIPSGLQTTAARTIDANLTGAQFGSSMAPAGDVNGDGYPDLIVGARSYYTGAETGEGTAFVFRGTPSGIVATTVAGAIGFMQTNQASAGLDFVGSAGDVNGDGYGDVVIGSAGYDDGVTNTGLALVFTGGASGVGGAGGSIPEAFAYLHQNQAGAALGGSAGAADVNGDGFTDLIVGVLAWDGAFTDQGEALVYLGGSSGILSGNELLANAFLKGSLTQSRFGYSVASAGDVNGDGFADVIVGAPQFDQGQTDEGVAFLFLGSAFGITSGGPSPATAELQGDEIDAQLGWSVASAGDVNGDGYADVIVGAPRSNVDGTRAGLACVFLGSASGIVSGNPSTAATTFHSNDPEAAMGFSVACAGDVNGDGYADVIVGAPFYGDFPTHGAAWIFAGGPTGIASGDPANAMAMLLGNQDSGEFGVGVASAGDVNGDGYGDVIVGADEYTIAASHEGVAYLFHGGANGIASGGPATASSSLRSNTVNGQLGTTVASAGDVNGDGYADVIIGAPKFNANNGAAWVFLGSAAGVPTATTATAHATFPGTGASGQSVAGIGDVDADGYTDIAIGRPSGFALVYRGSAGGVLSGSPAALLQSSEANSNFGFSLAGAGDVNGDGFADFVVGGFTMDNLITDEGEAFVYHGASGRTARRNAPRQLRGDGSGILVQPWASAHSTDRFRVANLAVDPAGRRLEKIEVETCPSGVPFGSGSCTHTITPAWTDAGPTGAVAFDTEVPAGSGLRRWRVRTLHASAALTKPGISAPPNPGHGPWFRFQGQLTEADVRVDAVIVAVERPRDATALALAPLANPARGRIALAATLPGAGPADLELFDVAGRRLAAERIAGGGRQTVTLQPAPRASGVYLVRLVQDGCAATAHVVFVR